MRGERLKHYCNTLRELKKKLTLLTQPCKDDVGFTLIELLVSITIMIILTFVGVSRYRDFNEREKLRQAIRDVKTALQEAQKRAQAGEMDETACFNRTFMGWRFNIIDNNSYEIKGFCFGGCVGPMCDEKFFNVKTLPDLPKDIYFREIHHDMVFKPFGLGVDNPITITLVGEGGRTESLSVNAGGEITLLATPPPAPPPSSPSPPASPPPTVDCYEGSTPMTTGWGDNLYDCEGTNKRCYEGSCVTCGGYLYSDSCSGCAGQGGQGCWYLGGSGSSCTGTCSSRGGCATGNWDDTSSCNVLGYLGTCSLACWKYTRSDMPAVVAGFGLCIYRGGGSVSCSVSTSDFKRACVCEY